MHDELRWNVTLLGSGPKSLPWQVCGGDQDDTRPDVSLQVTGCHGKLGVHWSNLKTRMICLLVCKVEARTADAGAELCSSRAPHSFVLHMLFMPLTFFIWIGIFGRSKRPWIKNNKTTFLTCNYIKLLHGFLQYSKCCPIYSPRICHLVVGKESHGALIYRNRLSLSLWLHQWACFPSFWPLLLHLGNSYRGPSSHQGTASRSWRKQGGNHGKTGSSWSTGTSGAELEDEPLC